MRGKKAILCIGYIIVATICIVSIALLFFSRNKNESEKSKRTIGALYMTMNNPYFEVINEEIKAVVESKGDVLETRDSGMDAKVQAKQVEKFIEEKVDCILINAVDWKKIGSSLEKAKKAGIPGGEEIRHDRRHAHAQQGALPAEAVHPCHLEQGRIRLAYPLFHIAPHHRHHHQKRNEDGQRVGPYPHEGQDDKGGHRCRAHDLEQRGKQRVRQRKTHRQHPVKNCFMTRYAVSW